MSKTVDPDAEKKPAGKAHTPRAEFLMARVVGLILGGRGMVITEPTQNRL